MVQRALWGFDAGAELGAGCDAGRMRLADLHTETGNGRWTFWQALGTNQRAQGASSAVTWARGIVAGLEPARLNGEMATSTGCPAHDVSILLGIGRQRGSQPGAKVSITIMRPPQRGQGQGSTRDISVAISGGCCVLAAGGATLRSARAVAMFSARLALAKSP